MPLPLDVTGSIPEEACATAAAFAQRITAALPLVASKRVSMHDNRGRVHWQSTEVWSPEEHEAVRLALEQFAGPSAPARASLELPAQRTALLLRASDRTNGFRGFVMMVVDNRQLRGRGTSIRDLPVPVQRAVHEWAMTLDGGGNGVSPGAEANAAELSPVETHQLLVSGPGVEDAEVDAYFSRLRAFPVSLVAQPLVPLQTGIRIKRYEVLLRDAGLTSEDSATGGSAPVQLLQEADSRGFGAVLDRRAAGALLVWLAANRRLFVDEPSQFSLNLSATTLSDPNFLQFIELCLAKAQIPPQLLAFELDECLWFSARARVERFSNALHKLGAGLVIDNCTLQEASPDLMGLRAVSLVKVARSLTMGLANNRIAQMRVGALAQMARIAGAHTVAKRVDDSDEQHQLQALGVDFVQGRAAAIPLSLPDLAEQRASQVLVDPEVPEAMLGN